MCVGETGLGKSTLLGCLFLNNGLYAGRSVLPAEGTYCTLFIDCLSVCVSVSVCNTIPTYVLVPIAARPPARPPGSQSDITTLRLVRT